MARRKVTATHSAKRFAAWRSEYESVLSETDTPALFKRLEAAEAAIRTRLADVESSLVHYSERGAMEEALASLEWIKRERLKFQ